VQKRENVACGRKIKNAKNRLKMQKKKLNFTIPSNYLAIF